MRKPLRNKPLAAIAGFSVAILAACSPDSPTSIGRSSSVRPPASASFTLSTVTSAVPGQITVCKTWDGTAGGNTTINAAAASGTPTLAGPAVLGNGQCAVIATTDKPDAAGNNSDRVTLTEAIPSNSDLEGAVAVDENGTSTPYVNGTTALFLNRYHGFTVTFTNILRPVVTGTEGCSLGYYKKHVQPTSTLTIGSVFTGAGSVSGLTLQDALSFKGGSSLQDAKNTLLRNAAASYFNSLRLSGYPLSTAQVIAGVNAALASNDRTTILAYEAVLNGYNNLEGPSC